MQGFPLFRLFVFHLFACLLFPFPKFWFECCQRRDFSGSISILPATKSYRLSTVLLASAALPSTAHPWLQGKGKDVTVKLQGLKCHLTLPNAVNIGASLAGKRQGTDKTTWVLCLLVSTHEQAIWSSIASSPKQWQPVLDIISKKLKWIKVIVNGRKTSYLEAKYTFFPPGKEK